MQIGAVMTADIVNSTLLAEAQEKKLKEQIADILQPYKHEFYRGDSFQAYLKDPKVALRILLKLRSAARMLSDMNDIRASIGIGEINPYIRKLSTATDQAFVLSGRAFDRLSESESRLVIESINPTVNHGFNVISYFVDYLLKGLTERQAEVLLQLLNNKTQSEAAGNLHKSASTINKHVQASGWYELIRVIKEYEQLVSTL